MFNVLIICLLAATMNATLIVNYSAPGLATDLGTPQLESTAGHPVPADATNGQAYIKPDYDSSGKPALHYHRDPSYRRAEVKAKGNYAENKRYFVGYQFSLSNIHEHLVLFQWYAYRIAE